MRIGGRRKKREKRGKYQILWEFKASRRVSIVSGMSGLGYPEKVTLSRLVKNKQDCNRQKELEPKHTGMHKLEDFRKC